MQTTYINLARKYRPQTVTQLIGQHALVKSLENAFTLNKIAHAFMLTGVRGVGKTSTARIVAKALNCIGEDGNGSMTLNPCGKCENCLLIMQDRHLDVIEIDAASKTGVDDIREIIENSQYKPTVARYKVFIIDEVHMLSKNAFNALLKTLEEPPEHLKFIFATTEIKKVPITVLSRCQKYDLKTVEGKELVDHLTNICNLENIQFNAEAIDLIAKAAQGSVRDSLSLLDRAIIYTNSNIQLNLVLEMLGYNNNQIIYNLFLAIIQNNHAQAFNLFSQQKQLGVSGEMFLEDLLTVCHNAMVLMYTQNANLLNLPSTEIEQLNSIIQLTNYNTLLEFWQILLTATNQLKTSSNAYLVCSMALLKMLTNANVISIDNLITLNDLLEGKALNSNAQTSVNNAPSFTNTGTTANHTNLDSATLNTNTASSTTTAQHNQPLQSVTNINNVATKTTNNPQHPNNTAETQQPSATTPNVQSESSTDNQILQHFPNAKKI